ncbi:hypothetical protein DMENIID0001_078740 [Sergentomyia squamirostris]
MGGCRCTFQTCENNSSNSANMHFFHFPAKKPELCRKWAKFANRLEFLTLPQEKLKNKVVCQAHFRKECFMNYLQCSLVKTAYPTLVRLGDGDVYLDLEKDTPEEREEKLSMVAGVVTLPQVPEDVTEEPTTPSAQQTFIIDMLPPTEEDMEDSIIIEQPPTQQNFVYDLKSLVDLKQSSKKKEVREPTILNANVYKRIKPLQSPGCVIKKTPRKAVILSDVHLNRAVLEKKPKKQETMRPDTTETIEIVQEPERLEVIERVPEVDTAKNAAAEAAIESMSKEIGELKKVFLDTVNTLKAQASTSQAQAPPATPPKSESVCKPDKNMTKMQIFKSIKRYVSPSMVALLRMEMFGGMDREWKDDEKEVAVDILNLGPNVYNFMKEEWRFRLPPEKTVQEWAAEM